MKLQTTLTTLSLLFLFSAVTAFPQQHDRAVPPVPAEKKRAMNKFDPVDIFPEAKERGGKDRSKGNGRTAQSSILANNASSAAAESSQPASSNRQRSRRRRSRESRDGNSETALAVNSVAAPTPVASVTAIPAPSLVAANHPPALPAAAATASSKSLPGSSQLSLPVILTLISLVLLALIFALARLSKQFRKSVN